MAKTGKPSKKKDKLEKISDQLRVQNQTLRKMLAKLSVEGDREASENENEKES